MLIYKITNLLDGKVYVGQTVKSLSQRWCQHLSQVRYVGDRNNRRICRYLHTAMRLYGPENFKIEEIAGANSESELNYLEYLWICKLDCLAPNGYNLRPGGNVRRGVSSETRKLLRELNLGSKNGMYGRSGSQKQKEWIRSYNTSRVVTEVERANMRAAQQLRSSLGLNKGFVGKKTPEQVERTASKLRKSYLAISPMGVTFYISNITRFCSVRGLSPRSFRKVMQGTRRSYLGWKMHPLHSKLTNKSG